MKSLCIDSAHRVDQSNDRTAIESAGSGGRSGDPMVRRRGRRDNPESMHYEWEKNIEIKLNGNIKPGSRTQGQESGC